MIKYETINKKLNNYKEVIELYYSAFPKYEQHPIKYLNLLAKNKNNFFDAYYEDNNFIGLSYLLTNDNMVFILYLATNPKIRSKGYGSQILKIIRERFPNKNIVLNVEPIDESADNIIQRKKRIEFYNKNNYVLTKYFVKDKNNYFSIMATDYNLNVKDYRKIVSRFTFGLYKPTVIKDNN